MQKRIPSTERIFYVYHHINENLEISDGGCRYIGKGKKYRASSWSDRNRYWHHIFSKANPPTIVLIAENLTEEEALAIEIQQIAFAREHGVKLCNLTDGGEGCSGWVPSEETKRKIALANANPSEETRRKISIAKSNPSEETRKKMKEAWKTRPPVTEATRKKQSESGKKKPPITEATREKRSKALKGKKRPPVTEETREKLAKAGMGRIATPETLKKKSDSMKRSWAKRKALKD